MSSIFYVEVLTSVLIDSLELKASNNDFDEDVDLKYDCKRNWIGMWD